MSQVDAYKEKISHMFSMVQHTKCTNMYSKLKQKTHLTKRQNVHNHKKIGLPKTGTHFGPLKPWHNQRGQEVKLGFQ